MSQPESTPSHAADSQLQKTLGPVMLWGLGVGYVISGEYFGWNLGLAEGGTYGMLFAFGLVTLMYVAFVFSYTELACAIPRAGGVFVYGIRGLGHYWGYLGGIAQLVEFVFAPPAIAMAIGAYASTWWPGLDPRFPALTAFGVFTLLNAWGVRQAATFELIVTLLAVGELLLFSAVMIPHFEVQEFTRNAWPHGWSGAFAAIPFAIWFYLAIEGVANAAEEARQPQRDVPLGFGAAMFTLIVLAVSVFVVGVGVGGWERIVYGPEHLSTVDGQVVVSGDAQPLDSPLPLALGQKFASDHPLYHLLIGNSGLGLIASLNGIILIAGRALFEMGRFGYIPRLFGTTHVHTHTPIAALLLNLMIGGFAILALPTGKLITMSAMGAVTLYIISMIALVQLRRHEPELERPYRAPAYPLLPGIAMVLAALALACMLWENLWNVGDLSNPWNWLSSITVWYVVFLGVASLAFLVLIRPTLPGTAQRTLSMTDKNTGDPARHE